MGFGKERRCICVGSALRHDGEIALNQFRQSTIWGPRRRNRFVTAVLLEPSLKDSASLQETNARFDSAKSKGAKHEQTKSTGGVPTLHPTIVHAALMEGSRPGRFPPPSVASPALSWGPWTADLQRIYFRSFLEKKASKTRIAGSRRLSAKQSARRHGPESISALHRIHGEPRPRRACGSPTSPSLDSEIIGLEAWTGHVSHHHGTPDRSGLLFNQYGGGHSMTYGSVPLLAASRAAQASPGSSLIER